MSSFWGIALTVAKITLKILLCVAVFAVVYAIGRLIMHVIRAGSILHGVKDTDAELLGLFVPIKCKINGEIVNKYPSTILREYRSNIISASAAENIPAAMLAGALYTEMRDYATHDWVFTGGNEPDVSVGAAQLEPEDVRRWVTEYSGMSDQELYDILMDPAQAINVLAKVLKTFSGPGASWQYVREAMTGYNNASTKEERAGWSGKMSAVKDIGEGNPMWDWAKSDWVIKGAQGYLTALAIVPELGE